MKYIGDIITDVRRDTRNDDVPTPGEQIGISTEDFLRYANFAQEKAFAVMMSSKSTSQEVTKVFTLSYGDQEIEIQDKVFLGESIKNVEYSYSGLDREYMELREVGLSRRYDGEGCVRSYIRHAGKIILVSKNNKDGAKLRVTYDRSPDALDLRRGQIVSFAQTGGVLTSLILSTASHDATALQRSQYLCVSDSYGTPVEYNIPISSYSPNTGIVTLGSYTMIDSSVDLVGKYVTVGKYSTTHSKLDDLIERFIVQYLEYKIFRRDSSDDAKESKVDMKETLFEIATAYAEMPKDEIDIQIDNLELVLRD